MVSRKSVVNANVQIRELTAGMTVSGGVFVGARPCRSSTLPLEIVCADGKPILDHVRDPTGMGYGRSDQ